MPVTIANYSAPARRRWARHSSATSFAYLWARSFLFIFKLYLQLFTYYFCVECASFPLIGKYHRHPAITTPLLAQATQGRKWHMRPRDQNMLAHDPGKQLKPRRRSRIQVE